MTTQQIVAEFAKGTVTDETYCWRDGMGDWLPLREIDELAVACGLAGAPAFAQPAATVPQARGSVRPQAAGQRAAAASPGSSGLLRPAPWAAQRRRRPRAARRRHGAADVRGSRTVRQRGRGGGENDVMTSAPHNAAAGRALDDGKMTGQRNENSVLFSLNALTASEPKKGPSNGDKLVGAAEGDGSGLIDIRALSSSMGSSAARRRPTTPTTS